MSNGYDTFGQERRNLQNGFSTLDAMRRIESALSAYLHIEEETKSLILKEQTVAFTELKDSVDVELREVLDDAVRSISVSSHDLTCCMYRIKDCIKRRVDYLSYIDKAAKLENDEDEKAGKDKTGH